MGCNHLNYSDLRQVSGAEAARKGHLVESCCSAVVGIVVELDSNSKLRLDLYSDEVADLALRAD